MKTLTGSGHFADPGFPLLVERHHLTYGVPVHDHTFHEVVLVERGRIEHEIEQLGVGRRRVRLGAGECILIAPGERHRYGRSERCAVWNLIFVPGLLLPIMPHLASLPGLVEFLFLEPLFRAEGRGFPVLRLDDPTRDQVTTQLAGILRELREAGPGWRLAALSHLLAILVALGRAKAGSDQPQSVGRGQGDAVEAAMAFIDAHHKEPLRLEDIAASAGLSPHYVSELFAARSGMSPWRWLTRVRIDRAKRLLKDTRMTVTEAGREAGFADPSYFARVFRQQEGLSPSAWRRSIDKARIHEV